jgi:lipoprotein-anchoring transpeptidase ErfK/SrfK
MRRHIYIHGTPDEAALGAPASHGCIRMSSADVIELFDLVEPGTEVEIRE